MVDFILRKCGLAGVEAMEASTSHVFVRHTHDAFAIGRIVDGAQSWWSGRGQVEARRGDMISSNPGEVHDGSPLGASRSWKMLYAEPWLVRALTIDASEGRSGDYEFASPVFERTPHQARFERCYRAMVASGPDAAAAAEAALILLFVGLAGKNGRRAAAAPAASLVRAKARIDDCPEAVFGLDAIARETGLSRWQALRGFTRLTGLPPHAYQVQRRLETAKRLIAGGTGLSEAAAATGFADQSHLHRMFVRRFGITPGAYAEALR